MNAVFRKPQQSGGALRVDLSVHSSSVCPKARAAYQMFSDAMHAGRDILRRAGVADPPPIPEFDKVFRRLTPELREELYAQLRRMETFAPADAIRLWQPLIRRAFGQPKA